MSLARKDIPFLAPIVRLRPGVTKEVAQQALHAFNQRLAEESPSTFPARGFTTALANYLDITVASGEMRSSLQLLLGAVAFLLLIACANVANLQLARGSARAREMAVRMSIGADRRRLVRQLLTESVVLSLAGGVLGVLFAFMATRTIVTLMPEFYVPNESRVTMNVQVLIFSLIVSVLTGIVFGLVPALQTSKADMTDALKASRSTGAGHAGRHDPQPPRHRRGRIVRGPARERRADAADVHGAPEHRLRHADRSGALRRRAAAARQVSDPGAEEPVRDGAARSGVAPAGRAGGDVRRSAWRGAHDLCDSWRQAGRPAAPEHQHRRCRLPADVRRGTARRPHVRCRGGDARRSGRTRQRVGGAAVAGRREPDRDARAPGGPRAAPGAAVAGHDAGAGSDDHRRHGRHEERRIPIRTGARAGRPLQRRRAGPAAARGADRRRSDVAVEPDPRPAS